MANFDKITTGSLRTFCAIYSLFIHTVVPFVNNFPSTYICEKSTLLCIIMIALQQEHLQKQKRLNVLSSVGNSK